MPSLKNAFTSIDEKAGYTRVSQDSSQKPLLFGQDSSSDLIFVPPARPSTTRRLCTGSLKIITILFAITGAGFLLQMVIARLSTPSEGRFVASLSPSCSCGGTTVAEAKRRGCVISPLAISWLPPHCLDKELADQFDRAGPGPNGEWDYWSDMNKTHRLTLEEIGDLAERDGVFYTTQEWHVMHCIYTWQKHYRAKWTGVTVERRSNGLDHIAHCAMVMRLRFELESIATVSGIALDADDPGDDGIHGEGSKGDKFELSYR